MRTTEKGTRERPGLIRFSQRAGWSSRNTEDETTWIFDGTQTMPTFENHKPPEPREDWGEWTQQMGILDYGTIKVKGHEDEICYRVGMRDAKRLEPLGWTLVGRGADYAYVTRGDLKP